MDTGRCASMTFAFDKWVIVGKDNCHWCHKAMVLLQQKDINYTYQNMDRHPNLKQFILDCGLKTTPQVFFNGYLIGDYRELEEWFEGIGDSL
jgi:glutaredoxin